MLDRLLGERSAWHANLEMVMGTLGTSEGLGDERHRANDQRGVSLIIVLAFITVFGLVMAGLLTETGANLETTRVVAGHDEKVYGADGGIEYAIKRLQVDPTLCSDPNSAPVTLTTTLQVNRPLTVTCQTISGSNRGIGGYTLVITGSGGSLQMQNGSVNRVIEGSVYNGGDWSGLGSNKGLDVHLGNITVAGGSNSCLPAGSALTRFLFMSGASSATPPYTYCTSSAPTPDAPHLLPNVRPTPLPAAGMTVTCPGYPGTVFKPGTFDATNTPGGALSLSGPAYFASGIYYFENVAISITGPVAAGQPATGPLDSPVVVTPPAAACDAAAGGTGSGATLILGGTSTIAVGAGGALEIFRRATGLPADGSPNLSLEQVVAPPAPQALPPGWIASAPLPGRSVLDLNQGDAAMHGIAYVPTGALTSFKPPNANYYLGGVKARSVDLDVPTVSRNALVMTIDRNSGARKVKLTSMTAIGGANDRAIVQSVAFVDFPNDGTTPVIESWSTIRQ
jgi:hypothetical protein